MESLFIAQDPKNHDCIVRSFMRIHLYTLTLKNSFLSVCENLAINNVTWYVNLLFFFIYIIHILYCTKVQPFYNLFIFIERPQSQTGEKLHRYWVFKIMENASILTIKDFQGYQFKHKSAGYVSFYWSIQSRCKVSKWLSIFFILFCIKRDGSDTLRDIILCNLSYTTKQ